MIWGLSKVKDIFRRDVMLLLVGTQGRGDGIITNTFKIIRRMFRYAVKKEIIATTPCYAFERGEELPRPVSRERNLTDAHFTPHDLRRTCATLFSEPGFSDATVDAILAHLKKGEIRTYNKNKYDNEKQQALEEWSMKLTCIIEGTDI